MPLIWRVGSPQEFISIGERLKDALYKELAGAMATIVTAAVNRAVQFSQERVDTGTMIGSISGEIEPAARAIIGRFGFLGQQQDYFLFQTVTGFEHYLSAAFIEPTFALRDAGELAKNDMIHAIEAAIRSVKL